MSPPVPNPTVQTVDTSVATATTQPHTAPAPPGLNQQGNELPSTSQAYTNKNLTALNTIEQKLTPDITTPAAPTPKLLGSLLSKLALSKRIEVDRGTKFIIDVQPDSRFFTYYAMFTTAEMFPDLDVKGFPYVSTFSLIGYRLVMLHSYMLINDLYKRGQKSHHSFPFVNAPELQDFLIFLQKLKVPSDVEAVIQQLSSTTDPSRPGLLFVPTYAGFSFDHDFGRSIPATLFFLCHNFLATVSSQADPTELLLRFYDTTLLQINGVDYKVSHLLGGPYSVDNDANQHANWLSDEFEAVFNPIVGRSLTTRPSLARLTLHRTNYASAADVNPYQYLIGCHTSNLVKIMMCLDNINEFLTSKEPSLPTMSQVLEKAAGITLMSHSIEPVTLPTWHHLPQPKVKDDITPISDTAFATHINFLVSDRKGKNNLKYPDPATIEPALYLVEDKKYDPSKNPIPSISFNKYEHVYPDVLWFQPYDKSTTSLNYTLILGLKIEVETLDGVTIPIPNCRDPLIDTNSQFIQGSIPVRYIRGYMPTVAIDNRLTCFKRAQHRLEENALGFARIDMSKVTIPQLCNVDVDAAPATLAPLVRVTGAYSFPKTCTYVAWSEQNAPPLPYDSVYLWSSFRHVENAHLRTHSRIHMYFTFRSMFGLDVTLHKSANPAKLLAM